MAATNRKKGQIGGRVRLDGGEALEERPSLSIHVVGEREQVLASAPVDDDGRFALREDALAEARRVVLTARDTDPADPDTATYALRPHAFRRAVEAGEIAVSDRDWSRFLPWRRHCVDATLRRCAPWRFVVDDLVASAVELPAGLDVVAALDLLPVHRCAPICEGVVEVYRKTCCCVYPQPPFDQPDLPDPFPRPFPDPFPGPRPEPWPGPVPGGPFPPPGPGPDPAPFDLQQIVLTGGAVDVAKVARLRQSAGAFGPPLCWCGPPVKVADGFVGEDGRIHVCWSEPFRLDLPGNCHDSYAFVVSQHIAGDTVTIYDGPAAGQWFDADDDIQLTSYHPRAVGCRDEDFPVPVGSPFVVLQDIGITESHRLRTPPPDGPSSVQPPASNSGLLDVGGQDHALGGHLQLRYHFSEVAGADLQALGARYYRVQWAPADHNGDPADDWETVDVPEWKTWRVTAVGEIVVGRHSLGPEDPTAVNGEHDLFHIPFETGGLLSSSEEWQDGQFHAVVPTDAKPEGRYLLRIEVFDQHGTRLDPASSGFTYRRWETPTTTSAITHDALTHLLWTDNRPVVGDIVDITGPGAGAGDCKFFEGGSSDDVTIAYRAYHPQPGTPSFMQSYALRIRRGISGTNATAPLSSTTEVGAGPTPASHDVAIGDLLDGEAKCSFAVTLHVRARVHNGATRLSGLDRHDLAAFAAELVSP